MRRAARFRHVSAGLIPLASAVLLAGCELALVPEADTPAPAESPAPPPAPEQQAATPSAPDDTVARYFAGIEARRISEGLLRTDVTADDVPFTARDVVENFVRIALYNEYVMVDGRPVSRATPAALRRWQAPVRMRLEFGESVPPSQRQQDRSEVAAYAARLGRLTGHPVSLAQGDGNFHVLVLSEAERRAIGPRLRDLVPGIDDDTMRIVTGMPLSTFCMVIAFSRHGGQVYTDAVAIIRAELQERTRRACFHEELAQGLGLPNDSVQARPSLFNDAAEFAVLTPHDELLLQILYDRRLRPGMREAQARPIVTRIVAELMGAES